ncbi:MAG: hypothetical protein ACI86H_000269 [bacterium]|jgi:hypothetical protein
MRVNQKIHWIIAIFFLVFPQFSFAQYGGSSRSNAQSIGQVINKAGNVFVIRRGKNIPVYSNILVKTGDTIKTNYSGKAQLNFNNGDKVFLASNTKILVDDLRVKEPNRGVRGFFLSVWGKIRAKVVKSSGKEFKVKTKTAVIGVKGTDFVVSTIGQKTTVGTLKGLVGVTSQTSGQEKDVPANYELSVSASGRILPLSAFSGRLLRGLEFAGKRLNNSNFSGKKLNFN